jgi:hypothetical protein
MAPFTMFQETFGARLFVLEHRFYGKSQPDNSPEFGYFSYLNTTYALADINYFIEKMSKSEGHGGPWFIVGAGYAGSLAAWYREVYPMSETKVIGSWASSAPIKLSETYSGTDLITFLASSQF